MEEKEIKLFGISKDNNFKVIDSIGVPHPYCISSKHLELNDSIYLDIEGAESKGAKCDICLKLNSKDGTNILSYKEHKQALLIECKKEIKRSKELKDYLNKIKNKAEKKGFVGFAFIRAK